MTTEEYKENPVIFDAGISISSFEHYGLGRYGDPLDPNGDMKAMLEMKDIIKKGGLLFLAVPIGHDNIVYNVHRIYGRKRFFRLIENWKLIESFGFKETMLDKKSGLHPVYQPVFVLENI